MMMMMMMMTIAIRTSKPSSRQGKLREQGRDSAKHSNRRTCNILGKMKDLRRYRVHAGGKQRNKKGQPTYHDRREERITLGRYLLNRLMHVDNRCQKGGECLSDILEKQEGKNKGYQQEPKHQQCDNSSWGLLPDLRLLDRFSSKDLGPCRSVHSVQSHSFMQFHSIGVRMFIVDGTSWIVMISGFSTKIAVLGTGI
ncbi:uncharacterized protein LOC135159225 isoform X1 [Lytechinus pictus]|uniref:uncharacterized protein LOC135156231 isoform X1 n=1 Tax=Lytechinus pictus TaxID=7653 RepID=UPI0030B9F5C8